MGYQIKAETLSIPLPEPYQGVVIVGLKHVKWKVLAEIASLAEKSDEEKAAGYLPRIEGWLRGWLKDWNIEIEAGKPLPLSEMGELPSDLVIAMFNAMSGALGGSAKLPPEPPTTSISTSSGG